MAPAADRVVLSVAPSSDDDPWSTVDTDWLLAELRKASYQKYLRRVHEGAVAVGDEWPEFVSCGCATPQDVVLRVERVEGGTDLADTTTLTVQPRRPAEPAPE